MDQKNDYRTPRDRITGEFLSELFLGDDDMKKSVVTSANVCTGCTESTHSPYRKSVCEGTAVPGYCAVQVNRSDVTIEGNYSLAMAYVPWQKFEDLFCEEEGFSHGTIFKRLRFPFYPTPCRKEADCK